MSYKTNREAYSVTSLEYKAGYKGLAAMIMLQAINDYKSALKQGNKGAYMKLEKFFRGRSCGIFLGALSASATEYSLDPEVIIEGIRKQVYESREAMIAKFAENDKKFRKAGEGVADVADK